jgi:hypothetical protein
VELEYHNGHVACHRARGKCAGRPDASTISVSRPSSALIVASKPYDRIASTAVNNSSQMKKHQELMHMLFTDYIWAANTPMSQSHAIIANGPVIKQSSVHVAAFSTAFVPVRFENLRRESLT